MLNFLLIPLLTWILTLPTSSAFSVRDHHSRANGILDEHGMPGEMGTSHLHQSDRLEMNYDAERSGMPHSHGAEGKIPHHLKTPESEISYDAPRPEMPSMPRLHGAERKKFLHHFKAAESEMSYSEDDERAGMPHPHGSKGRGVNTAFETSIDVGAAKPEPMAEQVLQEMPASQSAEYSDVPDDSSAHVHFEVGKTAFEISHDGGASRPEPIAEQILENSEQISEPQSVESSNHHHAKSGGGGHAHVYSEGICGEGSQQSPIDFPDILTATVQESDLVMNSEYYDTHEFRTTNSHGHTLQGAVKDGTVLTVTGGLMEGEKYILDSFHFHWGPDSGEVGSEHHVNGERYAAEMHLVHHNEKYSDLSTALNSGDPKGLAVIGILFELSSVSNPALRPILKTTNEIHSPGAISPGEGVNLATLLFNGEKQVTFGHYLGSLTTPGCNEVVLWNVKMTPNPISKEQLKALASLRDEHGGNLVNNYRGTQPINGREINFYLVKPSLESGRSHSSGHKHVSAPQIKFHGDWIDNKAVFGASISINRRDARN